MPCCDIAYGMYQAAETEGTHIRASPRIKPVLRVNIGDFISGPAPYHTTCRCAMFGAEANIDTIYLVQGHGWVYKSTKGTSRFFN